MTEFHKKISQLDKTGDILNTDLIPIARKDDNGIYDNFAVNINAITDTIKSNIDKSTKYLNDLDDVNTIPNDKDILIYKKEGNSGYWGTSSMINMENQNFYHGFENIIDSELQYLKNSNEFVLQPTTNEFKVYHKGNVYTLSTIFKVINFTNIDNYDKVFIYLSLNTAGNFFELKSGNIVDFENSNNIQVACVYYSDNNNVLYIGDERHLWVDKKLHDNIAYTEGLKKHSGLQLNTRRLFKLFIYKPRYIKCINININQW